MRKSSAFCIACEPQQRRREVRGPDLMRRLRLQSGGTNFVIRRMEDIHDAMSKIGVILHNQYLLGYYVPDEAQSGQYRRIAVQLLLPSCWGDGARDSRAPGILRAVRGVEAFHSQWRGGCEERPVYFVCNHRKTI